MADGDADAELDRLMRQYSAEASAAAEAVRTKDRASRAAKQGMAARRDDGLALHLPAANKGFQLLAKMGYKPGQGIGAGGGGRVAPVEVDLKSSRAGLGVDEAKKRQRDTAKAQQAERGAEDEPPAMTIIAGVKKARLHEEAKAAFLQAQRATYAIRQAESHVNEARKVIEALDEKAGLARHDLWPPQPPPPAPADGEEDGATDPADVEPSSWEALPAGQRLLDVLSYLRQRHHFCVFCKCQYGDEADMADNCPGVNDEDH